MRMCDPEFCTKRDCESKYDFSTSTSTLPTSIPSPPIVLGVVIGVAILSTLLGMGCYYCLCRRQNNGNGTIYRSGNHVELSNTSSMNGRGRGKTNGYSDDDSNNDEDDIEIDEEFDSRIRQRGQLA